jgi:tetratricopeptide (TPR) repeat protein
VDTDKLRSLIAEATRLAYEGQYDEAIDRYFEAKTVHDDPRLDFNIARCYHKKGDCQSAVRFYQAVLERTDAAPEDHADARKYLEELADCSMGDDQEVAGGGTQEPQDPQPTPQPEGATPVLTYAGWGATALGGLLLLGGLGLDLGGAGLVQDYEDAAASGDATSYDALRGDIESRQGLVFGLYGAGAALTLTGVVLLLLDGGESPQPTRLRLTPSLSPEGAGASVHWRF